MFVETVGRDITNRAIQERFQHSGDIVSQSFHQVLDALVEMYSYYMKLPDKNNQTNIQIQDNLKYASYFQDCLSALDGTHINTHISYKKHILSKS